jgi:hypothetical protein
VRVIADSHALIFYLFLPHQLTERALETLGEAEDTGGVVVSAATLGDLWYASHKRGPNNSFQKDSQLPIADQGAGQLQ